MLHIASHLELCLLVTPRGYREIRQRPDHGVTVAPVAAAVRAAGISCHGCAEDRRLFFIDGGVGDHHTQLDGAQDCVSDNRRRTNGGLGSPRCGGGRM